MGESNIQTRVWPSTRTVKIGFLSLLLITVVKNWILVGLIPLWQGPDEPVHFSYIQFIAEENTIPVYQFPYKVYHTDLSDELARSQVSLDSKFVSFNTINIQRFLYQNRHPTLPNPLFSDRVRPLCRPDKREPTEKGRQSAFNCGNDANCGRRIGVVVDSSARGICELGVRWRSVAK